MLLKLLVLLFEEGLRQGMVEVLKVLAEGAQAGGDGVVLHHHPFLGGGVQEVVVADNRAFDLLKIIKYLLVFPYHRMSHCTARGSSSQSHHSSLYP